jgi:hypothetical protein
MVLSSVRSFLFSCAAAGLTATGALAQDANYTSFDATSDKPVQLGYYASAHKDCTPGRLPTIRVIEAPKSGVLTAMPLQIMVFHICSKSKIKLTQPRNQVNFWFGNYTAAVRGANPPPSSPQEVIITNFEFQPMGLPLPLLLP